MVNLIRIPSSAYCSLHSGLILPASWAIPEADCKVCYAALRAAALEKSATTTLSVAFNLMCSLISGNSARTRNPILPITASKPVHPHIIRKQIIPQAITNEIATASFILRKFVFLVGHLYWYIYISMCVNSKYSINYCILFFKPYSKYSFEALLKKDMRSVDSKQ